MPRGSVQVETVESRVLRGNLPGDPDVRDLHVYLPPGYDDADDRYPVVWCLSGFTGRGRMLLNDGTWTPGIQDRMDALIASGRSNPMILALPDCFTHLGGSQYINSSGLGDYEDHVIEELVPLVDSRFRTLPEARHRGVMGKSSGGYGAIVLGMRHPDVFGAVADHSGDAYFEYCYRNDFARSARALRSAGGVGPWLERFRARAKKRHDEIGVLNIIAMAAAYSPNPKNPPAFCDLPFDVATGAIREDVWPRWLEHDPLRMAERHAAALRRLRLLYLDCGTEDEFFLDLGARLLAGRLADLGVAREYEEFEDGHMDISYRYDVSLPKLSAALAT
ncbi:MAG TPA: alpha/beta hydrolase-fold protein [Candidatus Eisenbacteria bacterium]